MLSNDTALLLIGGLCLAAVVGFVVLLDNYRQRQWRRRMLTLAGQLDVFTEASVEVAATLQSLLLNPQVARADRLESVPRDQLYALARRRLESAQPPLEVERALGLSSEEIGLLCVGQASGSREAPPTQPSVVRMA